MTGVTLGKYAAMVVIFLIPTGVLCVYPLLLTAFGSIYLPAVFSTVVVLLIGLICRLMTWNTPVSVTLMVVLEVALILGYGLGGDSFAGLFPSLVEELSLFEKFYQFVDGIFDVRCLVYFLTVILVFLFLTVQSLEKRRWSE